MYEAFYHLCKRPFAATPSVEHYYPARAIEAARRTLVRTIDRAEGIGVLVGRSGTGKTLVCQMLRHQFQETFSVAVLGRTRLDSPRALLQAILFELGLPCRGMEDGDLRLSLIDYLTSAAASRDGLLLVADEAHTLPARVLEEVRLITNVTVDSRPRVRLVLAGGPPLEERLASPKLESFSQRTAARCYLEPFDQRETADYVAAQMAWAGVEAGEVFSDQALEAVYRASDGIPRLVNQVCDHALVLAFADGVELLGEKDVEQAWADLQQLPTPWNESSGGEQGKEDVIQFGRLEDELDESREPQPSLRLADELTDADMEPAERLDRIEEHLASIDVGLAPAPATSVETTLLGDPFRESFAEEEEVVVDRFATQHAAVWEQMPHVYSAEGRLLSALLEPFVQATKALPLSTTPRWEGSEGDLIVVEDDPTAPRAARPAEGQAVRQEYKQLFAKLRRG